MKKLILSLSILFLLCSCGGSITDLENKESITGLKDILVAQFGADAYYTNLNAVASDYGPLINATQTKDPSSLKMEEWVYANGTWQQTAEVTLEISGNVKAQDFMYQIGKEVKFDVLGKCVEEAKQKIITEKKISDVMVESVSINTPSREPVSATKFYITIKPKPDGTDFDFLYNLDGSFNNLDY